VKAEPEQPSSWKKKEDFSPEEEETASPPKAEAGAESDRE
jgi:hypothetical protein